MTLNNKDYWKKRQQEEFEFIKKKMNDDDQVSKVIQSHMNQTINNINSNLDFLLQRFSTGDAVNYSDMLKEVNQKDIRAFEYDIKDIINEARDMESLYNRKLTYADFSDEVNARMKLYNLTMRVNRLEHLKAQIGLEMTRLGMKLDSDLADNLSDEYIAELKRQSGILGITNKVPQDFSSIFKIVHSTAATGDFSSRLWSNIDTLKSQLDISLNNALVKGFNGREASRELAKEVKQTVQNKSYVQNRLAITELSKVRFEAQKQTAIKNGFDKMGWVAEPSACSICKPRDGKIYDIEDFPSMPVHPHCKCSSYSYYRRSDD